VFGGIERESGNLFLVAVPDRSATTLMAVISEWIEPGTTVISDWWAAYRDLDAHGYTHQTVNHTIAFVDARTGAHTNTIESKWRHVKAFLNPYNRQGTTFSPCPVHVCCTVPESKREPVHFIPPHRSKHGLERHSPRARCRFNMIGCCPTSIALSPLTTGESNQEN
jgi:hypothetical protein